jgi:transposase
MRLNLHANATTTPKTRAYIQASAASEAELAAELGVSRKTVRRWRGRSTTQGRTSRPRTLSIRSRRWRRNWSANCAPAWTCRSTTSSR